MTAEILLRTRPAPGMNPPECDHPAVIAAGLGFARALILEVGHSVGPM